MSTITEPTIRLRANRDKPVRQQHPWVFSGAIAQIPDDVPDGTIVAVAAANGEWLARGYLNRRSQIQVRLLTWNADEQIDELFWRKRLQTAIDLRCQLFAGTAGTTNAYRLVNAESDYIPGLIVDRYGDYLVMEVGTLGIDRHKRMIAELLLELTGCQGVIERSDHAARRQEGLTDAEGLLAGVAPPAHIPIVESGLHFHINVHSGQKTGFFLDQRANRQRVAVYCAGGKILNAFSYTAAFAVYALAAGAEHVTNVDSSIEALTLGEENLRLNGFDPDRVTENLAGDVFAVLRDWRADYAQRPPTERFDLAILDPPKFVHSKGHMERGLRGYKDINLLAMQLLKPGGILATFSCSGLVSADLFQKVVFGAAVDAGRSVQVLEWLRHSPDHPVAITFPEGEYLKGLICRVL